MRSLFLGLVIAILLLGVGFGALVMMADGLKPEAGEVRIDVSDRLND